MNDPSCWKLIDCAACDYSSCILISSAAQRAARLSVLEPCECIFPVASTRLDPLWRMATGMESGFPGKGSGAFSRSLLQSRVVRDGLLPGQLVQLADQALRAPHALQAPAEQAVTPDLAAPFVLLTYMSCQPSSRQWRWAHAGR